MLRASSERTGRPADVRAVVHSGVDPLVPAGRELLGFTDAAVLRDVEEMAPARRHLLEVAGPDAVVRAAAVAGTFEMQNRLLDAIGARVMPRTDAIRAELGLAFPEHLRPA